MLAFIVGVSGCKETPKKHSLKPDKSKSFNYTSEGISTVHPNQSFFKDSLTVRDFLGGYDKADYLITPEKWFKSLGERLAKDNKEYFNQAKKYWYEIQVKGTLTNGCEFENRLTGRWIEHTSPSFLEIKELFKDYVKPYKIKDFEVSLIKIIDEKYALTKTTSFEPCNNQPIVFGESLVNDFNPVFIKSVDTSSNLGLNANQKTDFTKPYPYKDTTYMEKYIASIVKVDVSQGNTFEYILPLVSNQLLKVYKVQNIKNHELEQCFLDEKKSLITLPYDTKFIKADWEHTKALN